MNRAIRKFVCLLLIVSSLALTLCGCSFSARQKYRFRFSKFKGDYTLLDYGKNYDSDMPFMFMLKAKKYEKQESGSEESWKIIPGGFIWANVFDITTEKMVVIYNPKDGPVEWTLTIDKTLVDDIKKVANEFGKNISITKNKLIFKDIGKTYEISKTRFEIDELKGYVEFKDYKYKRFYANYSYDLLAGGFIEINVGNDVYLSDTVKYSYMITFDYFLSDYIEKTQEGSVNE